MGVGREPHTWGFRGRSPRCLGRRRRPHPNYVAPAAPGVQPLGCIKLCCRRFSRGREARFCKGGHHQDRDRDCVGRLVRSGGVGLESGQYTVTGVYNGQLPRLASTVHQQSDPSLEDPFRGLLLNSVTGHLSEETKTPRGGLCRWRTGRSGSESDARMVQSPRHIVGTRCAPPAHGGLTPDRAQYRGPSLPFGSFE